MPIIRNSISIFACTAHYLCNVNQKQNDMDTCKLNRGRFEATVVRAFRQIEKMVVGAYSNMERAIVGAYMKMERTIVSSFCRFRNRAASKLFGKH